MKIISFYVDDYYKPLFGRLIVEDDEAENVVAKLMDEFEIGEDVGIQVDVETPHTMDSLVKYIREIVGEEEDEDGG